jgi:hypothetical protein
MALQIRRGTDAERTAGGGVVFANGELVYVTDTDKLYIGDGATAGGMPMAGSAIASIGEYIVADTINSTLDLQQNLDLNGKDIIGTGNINIAGTITATGNINLGDDAGSDTVNLAAQITSSLTPNADATYDLGTTLLKWNNIHAVRLDGDVEGSVFGDDSTLLVDGVNNKIVGVVDTTSIRTSEDRIALGDSAGATNQDNGAVAIGSLTGTVDQGSQAVAVGVSAGRERQGYYATALGRYAGQNDQGVSAVAVGHSAARESQGVGAIAIGKLAGETNQAANSIVLNATGSAVENTTASSLVIKPVRDAVGTTAMMYNASNGEVTHTATPSFSITGNAATATNVAYSGLTGTAPTWDQDTTGTAAIATTFTVADEGTDTTCFPVFATAATGNVGGKTDSVLTYNSSNGTLSATAFVGNITGDAAGDHTGTFTGNVFTNLIDSADSSAIVITPSLRTSSDVTIDQELRVGSQNTFGPNGKSVAIIPSYDTGTGKVSTDTLEVRAIQITDVDGGIITLTGELDISKTLTTNAGHLGFGDNNLLAYSGVSASLRVAEFTGDLDQAGDFENAANFNNYMTVDSTVADFGTAVKFASMTTGVRNALTPAAGMVVFNTTETKLQVYTGSAWEDLH